METPSRPLWHTYSLLILTSIIWGANFVAVKVMLDYLPPLALQLLRIPVGVAVIFIVGRRQGVMEMVTRKALPFVLLSGTFSILINNNLFLIGVNYTTPVNASLVLAMAPLTTAAIASWMVGEQFRLSQWAGLFLSFAGVAITIMLSSGTGGGFRLNPGDLLMLGTMFSAALNTITLRKLITYLNPLSATFWSTSLGGLMALPINYALVGLTPIKPLDGLFWLLIAFAGILSTGLTGIWWAQAIRDLGAARASVFMNAVPVWAGLTGAIFLGQPITPAHLGGFILIFIGVRLGTAPPAVRPVAGHSS